MIMTARPHPPGDTEVIRNNKSHWSGVTVAIMVIYHTSCPADPRYYNYYIILYDTINPYILVYNI